MDKKTENFINLLTKSSLNHYDFLQKVAILDEIKDIIEVSDLNSWRLLGLPIYKNELGKIFLQTRETDINEQIFCVTDIETTGGVKSGQIIEIGALKIKNGVEIDRFESFIYASNVPENITELTGIRTQDLVDAPSLSSIMEKFRLFLGEAVFVAHNVKFDYDFISKAMFECGFGMLLNRKICTIELARRTIVSQKYKLDTLKELLGINNTHHRALSDSISCAEILKECISRLPWEVQTVEDLINFSKTAKCLKPPKDETCETKDGS